ncbi:hypothetical protein GCM10007887_20630 [Methylobacterium haplocladii]|uniref:Uncharacterized protein n=1 Tax=Methylobacterium haplocladii TaxID=1176176 RepID=A0A512IVK2_9HYPH|nr:hypothetical protein MHA02_41180 [Methylobacterium haplocladii]GLS59397.1 hypothetical protein GCM10007887_20630 [Methylobacterium haplocladii]
MRIEGNDYRFLGSGFRVYRGQQAFAHRAKNQIEIESLKISTCFAVVFVNTTKKYAGLVRVFGDEQEGLLKPFLRNALRKADIGDRILLEVHGGAPMPGQGANADRRSNVLRTLDHLAKNGIDPKAPGSCASPIDISFRVRWIDDDDTIDLRVSTWTGSVTRSESRSLAVRATEKRVARKTAATPMPKARPRSIPGKIKLSLPWTSHLEENSASPERVPPTGGYVPDPE